MLCLDRLYGPAALLVMLGSTVLTSSEASARILINVRFTRVEVEVSPLQTTHRSVITNQIATQGNQVMNPQNRGQGVTRFGQSANAVNSYGNGFTTSYRIVGGRIVQRLSFEGGDIIYTVATNGVNACSAGVRFEKKPGQRFFVERRRSNGETMYVSDKYAEDVSCTITEG